MEITLHTTVKGRQMLKIEDVPRTAYEITHIYRCGLLVEAQVWAVVLHKMLDGHRVEGTDRQGKPFYAYLDCFFATKAEAEASAAKDMRANS